MLYKGGDQVHNAVKCRKRPRRSEDQSSDTTSLGTILEYGCKLVLPLWLHVTTGTKTGEEMFGVRVDMSSTMHAFRPRLLRHVYGEGKFDIDGDPEHKEASRKHIDFHEQ